MVVLVHDVLVWTHVHAAVAAAVVDAPSMAAATAA